MQYRKLGRSGLDVSTVSLGGWITFGGSVSDRAARKIVRAAVDRGVNFIDLADVYAKGEAERVVGRLLGDYRRSDLVISSKVFGQMSDAPNDRGLSRKHVMESVERSLRNLGTDYLDVYFCHREDPETPLEETACAMDDLVRQGKILYWGTSVWSVEALERAHALAGDRGLYAPRVEQPRYNLLDRHVEAEVMPAAKRLGMGLVVWSPLAGGMLTGKYDEGVPADSRGATTKWLAEELTEENLGRTRRFSALARELGVAPGTLALAWCLRRPEVTSVITGATRPEHVESNVAAAELEVPRDALDALEEIFPAPE